MSPPLSRTETAQLELVRVWLEQAERDIVKLVCEAERVPWWNFVRRRTVLNQALLRGHAANLHRSVLDDARRRMRS